MARGLKRNSENSTESSSTTRRPRLENGRTERAHSSRSAPPSELNFSEIPPNIKDMHFWVVDLNNALKLNQSNDDRIEQKFSQKIESAQIYQHPSFWAKFIGSVICEVRDRPEATLGWIHYSVVMLLNSIDNNKFTIPKTSEMLELIKPFIVIQNLFANDYSAVEHLKQYQFAIEGTSIRPCVIIKHQSKKGIIEIAKISKQNLPRVERNICLVLAMILSLYDEDQVSDVLQLLQADQDGPTNIASFLKKIIIDASAVQIGALFADLFATKRVRQSNKMAVVHQEKSLQTEPARKIEAAVYAMICIQKCIKEFPNENFFKENYIQIIPQLILLASHKMSFGKFGRFGRFDFSKHQVYAIQVKILAHSTLGLLRSIDSSCFVSAPSNAKPISSGCWMFGNLDATHQAYQLDITEHLRPRKLYYCEFLVLTCGPLLIGFSPALTRDNDDEGPGSANWVGETANSIFFDAYNRSLWINGNQFKCKSKATQSNLPDNREGIVLGILLDTSKRTVLEAVKFYIDGQIVKQIALIDSFNVGQQQPVPWTANRLPENSYYLTFALTAYQQGVVVLQRDNWKFAPKCKADTNSKATKQPVAKQISAHLNEFPVSIEFPSSSSDSEDSNNGPDIMQPSTSAASTSAASTSGASTSAASISAASTSAAPTSVGSISAAPTSAGSISAAPTFVESTSAAPTSAAPTSAAPTSAAPTSAAPTSAAPTSAAPTSAAPTSATPTSAAPTSAAPTSVGSASAAPTFAAPTSAAPTSVGPAFAAPTSVGPAFAAPTSVGPAFAAPTSVGPAFAAPTSVGPAFAAPTSVGSASAAPTSVGSASAAPTSAAPTSATSTSAAFSSCESFSVPLTPAESICGASIAVASSSRTTSGSNNSVVATSKLPFSKKKSFVGSETDSWDSESEIEVGNLNLRDNEAQANTPSMATAESVIEVPTASVASTAIAPTPVFSRPFVLAPIVFASVASAPVATTPVVPVSIASAPAEQAAIPAAESDDDVILLEGPFEPTRYRPKRFRPESNDADGEKNENIVEIIVPERNLSVNEEEEGRNQRNEDAEEVDGNQSNAIVHVSANESNNYENGYDNQSDISVSDNEDRAGGSESGNDADVDDENLDPHFRPNILTPEDLEILDEGDEDEQVETNQLEQREPPREQFSSNRLYDGHENLRRALQNSDRAQARVLFSSTSAFQTFNDFVGQRTDSSSVVGTETDSYSNASVHPTMRVEEAIGSGLSSGSSSEAVSSIAISSTSPDVSSVERFPNRITRTISPPVEVVDLDSSSDTSSSETQAPAELPCLTLNFISDEEMDLDNLENFGFDETSWNLDHYNCAIPSFCCLTAVKFGIA